MQFIVSGQRIAVENFVTGKLYTILWKNDTQVTLTCISIGADCVVFQGEAPLNLFTLTMQNADTIDTIEPTQLGTTNYNNLINKPSINGVDLIGNKTSSALGIRDVPAIIEADDGKILTASSDGTYTWQPVPSSGTMDYTELNNKPQINSVTLTGNVSLADLGAAAAADIPTTPADIGAEPAITSENMLDADLVDDTSSTHKFATAAQLAQIGTNENNILNINTSLESDVKALKNAINSGSKNLLPIAANISGTLASKTTVSSDGTITITLDETLTTDSGAQWEFTLQAGTYKFTCGENSSLSGTYDCFIGNTATTPPTTVMRDNDSLPGQTATIESGNYRCSIRIRSGAASGVYTFKPMLANPDTVAIDSSYQPYAPTNAELYQMILNL